MTIISGVITSNLRHRDPPPDTATDDYFSDVVFLSHFDGADGATTATDTSDRANVLTFNGDAQIDTAQSKFGGASLLLDGTGDYVTAPDSTAFEFGSDSFTVEFWVRFAADPGTGNVSLVGHYTTVGDQRGWLVDLTNNNLRFAYTTAGTGGSFGSNTTAWNPAADTWYYITVCRTGGDVYLFVDGSLLSTQSNSVNIFAPNSVLSIGATGTGLNPLNGWIDDVRITNGFARYTSTFTAPTEPHPDTVTNFGSDADFSDVVFLAPFDGTDGATTATDESNSAHTLTFNGSAALDADTRKYGTASLNIVNTSNDYVSAPDSTDFEFGTGQFTVELWVRWVSDPSGTRVLVGHYNPTGDQRGWVVDFINNQLRFGWTTNGQAATFAQEDYPWNPSRYTWYHVAVCRDSTTLYFFVDGALLGSVANTVNIYAPTAPLTIGALGNGGSGLGSGWIEDVRITNGVCRYTAAFDRPTAPFPTS